MTRPAPDPRCLSITQGVLRGNDLAADATTAADGGFDGLGLALESLRAFGGARAATVLREHDLQVSSVMACPDVARPERAGSIDDALAALDLSAEVGSPHLVVYTGPLGDRAHADADAACARWFDAVVPRALDVDVTLALEPMFPVLRHHTYVHTVCHALRIVAPFEPVQVVVDTAHLWWDPDLLDVMRADLDRIALVQLSNVCAAKIDRRTFTRAQVDAGVVPLRELLAAIDALGYRGWYEHEVLVDDVVDRPQFARDGREWFDTIWTTGNDGEQST